MTRELALLVLLGSLAHQSSSGSSRPFKGVIHAIPGTIEAEDFDEGGEGIAYHDREPENLEKRRPAHRDGGVDLEWRATASRQYNLGWTRAGEWLMYTVEVREAGVYRLEMMVASSKKGGTFHVELNGADKTGPIEIPDTGGWQHLKPMTKERVTLEAGRYVMKVVMDTEGPSGSIGDIDYYRFVRP